MVSETILQNLNAAVIAAGNKRNHLQMSVNNFNMAIADATANVQRAQTQERQAEIRNENKKTAHHELLDYYNGLADKNGLGSVLERIETLAAEQLDTHRLLIEAREIRERRAKELEQIKVNLAGEQLDLDQAVKDWQRVSAEAEKARNER